jgi:hypothetical protein
MNDRGAGGDLPQPGPAAVEVCCVAIHCSRGLQTAGFFRAQADPRWRTVKKEKKL